MATKKISTTKKNTIVKEALVAIPGGLTSRQYNAELRKIMAKHNVQTNIYNILRSIENAKYYHRVDLRKLYRRKDTDRTALEKLNEQYSYANNAKAKKLASFKFKKLTDHQFLVYLHEYLFDFTESTGKFLLKKEFNSTQWYNRIRKLSIKHFADAKCTLRQVMDYAKGITRTTKNLTKPLPTWYKKAHKSLRNLTAIEERNIRNEVSNLYSMTLRKNSNKYKKFISSFNITL